jgi:FkbM family methyltransferase
LRSTLMGRLLRSSRDIFVGSLSSIPYLLLEFEEPMFLKFYFPPDGFGALEENLLIPESNVYFDIHTIGNADTIIDLGAHSGSFTIYSLLYSKPRAKIIAVEPDGNNYRLLLNNLKIFENVINEKKLRVLALRKAVWAKTGTLKFIKTRWSEGGYVADITDIECDEVTCVDAITLDDIINISSGKTIVKADIEGAEIPVLAASSKLSMVSELAIEAHGNTSYLIRLLKLKGYNPKIITYRLNPHLARQWLKVKPKAYGLIIAIYRFLASSTYKPTITIVKASRSHVKS